MVFHFQSLEKKIDLTIDPKANVARESKAMLFENRKCGNFERMLSNPNADWLIGPCICGRGLFTKQRIFVIASFLVYYTAVFSVVTQRSSPQAVRDDI